MAPGAVNDGVTDGPENHGVPDSNLLQPYCNRASMDTYAMDELPPAIL
jgi:hypothetical protein